MSRTLRKTRCPRWRWAWAALAVWLLAGCTVPVRVEWATEVEMNTAGFDLYRGEAAEGPFDYKVNAAPIPASTDPMAGGEYSYVDRSAQAGQTYYYQLQELELNGTVNTYGPIEVRASWLDMRWAATLALGAAAIIVVWAVARRRSRPPGESPSPDF